MIRSYLKLVRPFTSFPPVVAVTLGSLAGAYYTGSDIDIVKLIPAIIAMVSAQIFGQVTNQLTDPVELDRINNKDNRVLVSGELSRNEVEYISMLFLMLSVSTAYLVNIGYFVCIIVLLLCTYLYNYEPIRLKKRFMLNNLILTFSRGFVPVIATWIVFSPITEECIYFAIGVAIWVFGWQTTKDIPDVDGDRQFGIKTVPVVFGIDGTIKFIGVMTLIFFVYHFILAIFVSEWFFVIGVVLLSLGVMGLKEINKKTFTENTFGWFVFYIGIVMYYVLMVMGKK